MITGAIAIAISVAYLLIVQILDFRSEMIPAPMGWMWMSDYLGFFNSSNTF